MCYLQQKQKMVMKGSRSKDNCYLWISHSIGDPSTCMMTSKVDETKLWHQKLCRLNLKNMKKIFYEEVVKGLPKLKIEEGKVCEECQIGKQTKMPHKKLQHLSTIKFLELFHMDLVGPMQVESL